MQYLISLQGADGRGMATLRVHAGASEYQATLCGRAQMPPGAEIWLFTPDGPLCAGARHSGPVQPVLGAAMTKEGRCLCAGATRGVSIDLEREKMNLRMLLHTSRQPVATPLAPQIIEEKHAAQTPSPAPSIPEEKCAVQCDPPEAPNPANQPEAADLPEAPDPPEAVEAPEPVDPPEAVEAPKPPAGAESPEEPEPVVPAEPIAPAPSDAPGMGAEEVAPKVSGSEPPRDTPMLSISNRVPPGAEVVSGREPPQTRAVPPAQIRPDATLPPTLWLAPDPPEEAEPTAPDAPLPEWASMPAPTSRALTEILSRAQNAFSPSPVPSPVPTLPGVLLAPNAAEDGAGIAMPIPNPFPNTFSGASFRRVHRAEGQGWYLEGDLRRGDERWQITAVPGEYQPMPPHQLQGFYRYVKARDGGYWVRTRRRG